MDNLSPVLDSGAISHSLGNMPPPRTSRAPVFVSRSDALRTDYHVWAEAGGASAHAHPTQPMPVVVVLDGDYFFDDAVRAARELHSAGVVPLLLIVGVGYGKAFGKPGNRRGRDYTPTASTEEPESGGAAAFLAHLGQHIVPELERRYRIDRARSALAGHSLSALCVLYALFQDEPLFRRAIAGAPSIWWDDCSVLKHIAAFRGNHSSLTAELFIGVGEDETPSMLGDLDRFDAQLRAGPFADLSVVMRRFPGRTHYDLTPELFRAGIQALYEKLDVVT